MMKHPIRLFEMFAGYGGASFALKKAGISFECVGYSEIDKYAIQCYEQNHYSSICKYCNDFKLGECFNCSHNKIKNYGEATKINPKDIPDFDLLTGGGNSGGNHSDMDVIIDPKTMLLNQSNICHCIRAGEGSGNKIIIGDFRFDEGFRKKNNNISPCLHANMIKKGISNSIIIHSTQTINPNRPILKYSSGGSGHLCKSDGTSYCLDTGNTQCIEMIGSLQENASHRKDGISPVLTSATGMGGGQTPIIKNNWRRLTPKECFRLMGFLNDEINLDRLSDTQKYKLAGNGCDINLVSKIFKRLFECKK